MDARKKKLAACSLVVDGLLKGCGNKKLKTLKSELDELTKRIGERKVAIAIMESGGAYWRHPFRQLKEARIKAGRRNAREIENAKG